MKKLCVDLDGTLIDYSEGWQGEDVFGDAIPGAADALGSLRAEGWQIIVFTTRGDRERVAQVLRDKGIPFDTINEDPASRPNTNPSKPQCQIYVDDQAIQFNGDWVQTLNQIRTFERWEIRAGRHDEPEERGYAFLKQDFDQAHEQLRFYDTREWEIFKYFFSTLFAVVGGSWTLYSYGLEKSLDFSWVVVILMTLIGAIALIVNAMLARNRLYFTVTARYLNAQRGFFLSKQPGGFQNPSGYYTDFARPEYYHRASLHTRMMRLISVVGSFLIGTSALILVLTQGPKLGLCSGCVAGLAIALGVLTAVLSYWLHSRWVWRIGRDLAMREKATGTTISADETVLDAAREVADGALDRDASH